MKNTSAPKGSLLLKRWMKTHSVNNLQIAAALLLSDRFVVCMRAGQKRPGIATAWAIEHMTQGKVPATSWISAKERQDFRRGSVRLNRLMKESKQ